MWLKPFTDVKIKRSLSHNSSEDFMVAHSYSSSPEYVRDNDDDRGSERNHWEGGYGNTTPGFHRFHGDERDKPVLAFRHGGPTQRGTEESDWNPQKQEWNSPRITSTKVSYNVS